MVRLPHPSDKPRSQEQFSKFLRIPTEINPELEEHINNADYWATDWELRELEFEKDARQAEHGMYIEALHKVCRDYCHNTLSIFPLGVARWLEKEVEKVLRYSPSQLIKSSIEGTQTANFGHSNQFELLREEWEAQERNPALILQTLHKAQEIGVTPPDWAIEQLVNAGAKVFETSGDIGFEEALGLTPRKIKFALSDQKKQSIADLVAEALDAELSPIEARELAIYEAEIVYGWQQYAPGTVQKYYETHAGERNGFMQSFLYSFEWFDLIGDEVFQSIGLPAWRKQVLKLRLQAYREAMDLFSQNDDRQRSREQRLRHVTSRTVAALRRTKSNVDAASF